MENQKIYLWIQHYKDIALSLLPAESQFDNVFRERMMEIAADGVLCFRRLVSTFPRFDG